MAGWRASRVVGAVLGALGVSGVGLLSISRIAPLLPPDGGSTCFSGAFDGSDALALGWPREHREDEAHVTRLTLRLDRPPGQTPYRANSGYRFDWRYAFSLLAETADRGSFRAGGQCDWNEDLLSRVDWGLDCFIDCEGGGIDVSRVPGREALLVSWDAGGWLRMTGCGDGGEILRAGDVAKSFKVDRAAPDVCAKALPPE